MRRVHGLALVGAMLTPGALIGLGLIWPTYTAITVLAALVAASVYAALFVWPHLDEL